MTVCPADEMVCFEVDPQDLKVIKNEAKKRGISYQTLIEAILHQFAIGKITVTL